jgi:hypothetical protein
MAGSPSARSFALSDEPPHATAKRATKKTTNFTMI